MLVLEKQEKYEGHQQFFAVVLLIGTRKQAENFAYRLELNGNRRRLTWEATPRSIHDGVAAAIMNSDCLVFDTSIAHLFADNGNLGINVTISMCWRSRGEPPAEGGVKEVQSAPADSLSWSRSRSRLKQSAAALWPLWSANDGRGAECPLVTCLETRASPRASNTLLDGGTVGSAGSTAARTSGLVRD